MNKAAIWQNEAKKLNLFSEANGSQSANPAPAREQRVWPRLISRRRLFARSCKRKLATARNHVAAGGHLSRDDALKVKSPLIRNRQVCSRNWSGRRESNPRHTAWEAVVLPLNYARAGSSIAKPRRQQQGAKARPRTISRGRTAYAIRLWHVAGFCAG